MERADAPSPNNRLRQERLRRNWRQSDVADQLGTTVVTVNRWERGTHQPGAFFRLRLCALFEKSAEELGFSTEGLLPVVSEKEEATAPATPTVNTSVSVDDREKSNDTSPIPPAPPIIPVSPVPVLENPASPQSSEQWESFMRYVDDLSLKQQDRRNMLDKIHRVWIKGLLERSLKNVVTIEMDLREQPDVVEAAWKLHLEDMQASKETFTAGSPILDLYENAHGKLLILGEPGSGKTTLLLQLTKSLLEHAKNDVTHPIPVIFHLASWGEKQQPIEKWLVAELSAKYHIPATLSQQWIEQNQLMPLFDGLDEVSASSYSSCIEALNSYLREHGLVPTVICSRRNEYLGQSKRLVLQSAVLVQPLTEQQIDLYLQDVQERKEALHEMFHQEPALERLARTPLMLRMLTSAYETGTIEATYPVSAQAIQQQAFTTYILQMFRRRSSSDRYSSQQTIHYLQWLARQLHRHNQSDFYIEFMQLDWLPSYPFRPFYSAFAVALGYGLLGCVGYVVSFLPYYAVPQAVVLFLVIAVFNILLYSFFNGIVFGVLADEHSKPKHTSSNQHLHKGMGQKVITVLKKRVIYGALNGLLNGIFIGLITNPAQGCVSALSCGALCTALGTLDTEIKCAESLKWSLASMVRNAYKYLSGGLFVGFFYGLVVGYTHFFATSYYHLLSVKLLPPLLFGLIIGLLAGLMMSIRGGFIHRAPNTDNIVKPNQGIRNSIRNSVFFGTFFGIAFGLLFGFIYGPLLFLILGEEYRSAYPFNSGLIYGIADGLAVAGFFWLLSGGIACIQHTFLRLLLWIRGSIPWNYAHFLDRAVDLAFLHKLGGGYIFFHNLLQEYFANLDDEQIKGLLTHLNKMEKP